MGRSLIPQLMFEGDPQAAMTLYVSLFVECQDLAELEQAWATLLDGDSAMMPLDHYGFSQRFGWLSDRFGVSWQLNLA